MRTRSFAASGQGSRWSARCASSAAASASDAVWNAAQNASPPVLKTWPPWSSMHWRSSASWRASAARIAACCVSHSRVLPSMSVNRNVTVPVGSGFAAELCGVMAPHYRRIRRSPAEGGNRRVGVAGAEPARQRFVYSAGHSFCSAASFGKSWITMYGCVGLSAR